MAFIDYWDLLDMSTGTYSRYAARFVAKNNSSEAVTGVSFLWEFAWWPTWVGGTWDNADHRFENGTKWVGNRSSIAATPPSPWGADVLLSETNLPLSSATDFGTFPTQTRLGTDLMPMLYLGDFAAGQQRTVIAYVYTQRYAVPPGWSGEARGYFVKEGSGVIPEPAPVAAFASGLALLGLWCRRRRVSL